MKKIMKKAVALLLLFTSIHGYNQESKNEKKTLLNAKIQLIQGGKNYNPNAAIATYQQLAAEGNAEAMNDLGMLFTKGIAVAPDVQKGINWLEKAAENGYPKAWYNLGILYHESSGTKLNQKKAIDCFEKAAVGGFVPAWQKWGFMQMKGAGVTQDYPKAFALFKKGAEKGNALCMYSLGYLYYKGFGCDQDYEKAVIQFELAAKKREASSMYMLGLCYRNGYGVSIDTEKAKYWLNKSAALGYKAATIELNEPEAENTNPNQTKSVSTSIQEELTITETNAPKKFKKIKQQTIKDNISGNYTGTLIRYDWSGQNSISNTPIQVELKQNGQEITGEWKEEKGNSTSFKAKIQDNSLVFYDTQIDRADHYHKEKPVSYEFKEAKLQVFQTDESLFIVGNLQLYNIKEQEIEKPTYLILENKTKKNSQSNTLFSSVVLYPNPIMSDFNLSFNLAKAANVTMGIFDFTGQPIYTEHWPNMTSGKQSKTIALNAPKGYYLLRLTYENEVKTTIIIKQ